MTRFSIYLDPGLNTWLEERAKEEGRSKAKQVAHILKLYRDIIDGHASVLARPGYSLEDERWSSLKANNRPATLERGGKRYVIAERGEEE